MSQTDKDEASSCNVCKEIFEDDRVNVRCHGCNKYYHSKCANINLRGFHLRKSAWRCLNCIENPPSENIDQITEENEISLTDIFNLLGKINSQCSEMQKKIDSLADENKALKSEINTLRSSNVDLIKLLTNGAFRPQPQPTQQLSATRPLNATERNDSGTSYAQVASSSIVIRPKDKQSNAVTKTDLLHNVNPVTANVSVSKVKHIRDGGILVSCCSKDDAIKLSKEAADRLADRYTIKEVTTVNPRIRIVGMSEEHDESTFLNYIKVQNSQIFNNEEKLQLMSIGPVKAKHSEGKRKSKVFQAVVQLGISAYTSALSAGQLFIGYDCCSVYDAVDITRCYNCCGFHHISAKCRSRPVCPRCTGSHQVRECKSESLKCLNCFSARGITPDIDFNHAAWDRGCVVFQQKLKLFKADNFGLK